MSEIKTMTVFGHTVTATTDENGYVYAREYLEQVNNFTNDDKSLAEFFRNKSTKSLCLIIEDLTGSPAYKITKLSRKGLTGSKNDIVMMHEQLFDFFVDWLNCEFVETPQKSKYFEKNWFRRFVNWLFDLN